MILKREKKKAGSKQSDPFAEHLSNPTESMYALDFVAYLLGLPRGYIQILTNCIKFVHGEKPLVN